MGARPPINFLGAKNYTLRTWWWRLASDWELVCWLWHCTAMAVALKNHERANAFNLVSLWDRFSGSVTVWTDVRALPDIRYSADVVSWQYGIIAVVENSVIYIYIYIYLYFCLYLSVVCLCLSDYVSLYVSVPFISPNSISPKFNLPYFKSLKLYSYS